MFTDVRPTGEETQARLPGDDLLGPEAWVVDSAMDLSIPPDEVRPWLEQIGRRDDISTDAPDGRGGWPLPRSIERLLPKKSRALREVDPSIKPLEAGDRIRDWFGRTAMIDVVEVDPSVLVLRGERPERDIQWVWTLALGEKENGTTRVHSRTRIEGLGRLGRAVGKAADRTVAAGLRAGLEERFAQKYPILDNPIAAFNINQELTYERRPDELEALQEAIDNVMYATLEDPLTGDKVGATLFVPDEIEGPDVLVPLPLEAFRSDPIRILEGAEISTALKSRVLMTEYPGFGDSTTNPHFMRSVAAGSNGPQARSLKRAIDHDGPEDFGAENLTVFGESLGGALSLCYTEHADVDNLVLFESANLYYPPAVQFSILGGLMMDNHSGSAFRKEVRVPHATEGLVFEEPFNKNGHPANRALMFTPGFGMGRGFTALQKGLARNPNMNVKIISAENSVPFRASRIAKQYEKLHKKYGDRVSFVILPGEFHSTAPFNFRRIANHISDAVRSNGEPIGLEGW